MAPSAPLSRALLERESELDALARAAADVRAGTGRLVVVGGDSGLGKSALLAAGRDLAAASGLATAGCRGLAVERDAGYGLVVRLLEPLLNDSVDGAADAVWRGIGPRVRRLFGLPAAGIAGDVRHELFRLAVRLAERCGGLCLAVDDAHDADPASLAFLHHAASRLSGVPLLLLVAARPLRRGPGAVRLAELTLHADAVLPLRPLSDAAVATLVRSAEPQAPDALCASCAHVSRGNPFLLRELLASLHGRLADVAPEEVARLRPEAVSRSVLVRLAALPPDAVALARAAAVLGGGARIGAVAEVAGVGRGEALALLDDLADAAICRLTPAGTVEFGHPVVEASVTDEIPAALHERLHAAAAAALQAIGAPEADVRRHLLGAARGIGEWAVALLRRCAAAAAADGRLDEAVRSLHRVLDEPLAPAVRAEVTAQLAGLERRAAPDGLTAAEHRVVALARAGYTNREIADQLCVSAKTVEYHLGNVFAKLQIRSRRELRGALALQT